MQKSVALTDQKARILLTMQVALKSKNRTNPGTTHKSTYTIGLLDRNND